MSGSILINYSYFTYQQITTQLFVCFPIKCYLDFMSTDILRDSEKFRGKKSVYHYGWVTVALS